MSLLRDVIGTLLGDPECKGKNGEEAAAFRLEWTAFRGYEGEILRNVYVPRPQGGTSEIDLLYITRKGMYVIESKNYSGYIFGREQDQNWTVTLYAGRGRTDKYHFYNPIKQNDTHIRCLRRYIGAKVPMISIVLFSNRCELKNVQVTREDVVVCQQGELSGYIKRIWNNSPDVLTEEQIQTLREQLAGLSSQDEEVKQEHIQEIQQRFDSTEVCPRCGGKLVLRTAKTGSHAGRQFYGCSNYPRCHYTKNMD